MRRSLRLARKRVVARGGTLERPHANARSSAIVPHSQQMVGPSLDGDSVRRHVRARQVGECEDKGIGGPTPGRSSTRCRPRCSRRVLLAAPADRDRAKRV